MSDVRASRIRAVSFLVLLLVLTGGCALAQVSTASINGIVQDASGAVVVGADVQATQTETRFTSHAISSSTGAFTLPSLPVGPYQLSVTKSGFQSYEQSGIVLTVGQNATIQVSLKVGSESQTVTVTAEAPVVDSSSSTIQNVVAEQTVSNLPLNGRNPATLINTVPGVTDATLNGTTPVSTVKESDASPPQESAPTVNGTRPGGTYFSLDGASNVDPWNTIGGPFPNPDATQEFGVVTGSYGARFVSAPGGAVNIVTKSGTNGLHGSVFEYIRNNFFNATTDVIGSTIPDTLKRHQFGFAVGGPILRDKLFFFGSFQQTLVHQAGTTAQVVPTQAERDGVFTSTVTGATVHVPLSPTIQNFLSYIPLPGPSGFADVSVPSQSTEPQGVAKIDYVLGSHRLFGRYFGDHYSSPDRALDGDNFFQAAQGRVMYWDTAAAGDTWSSKAGTWVSDLRVSMLRAHIENTVPAGSEKLALPALGAKGVSASVYPALPIMVGPLFAAGAAQTAFPRNAWDVTEDVTHIAGKHQITFGTDMQFVHFSEKNVAGQNGVAIFAGLKSLILFGPLNDNGMADEIMGSPLIWIQGDGFFTGSHGNVYGFYGEDKYQASNRLTLTGGLRWDPYLPFTLANGHVDCWVPGQQSVVYKHAPMGLAYPGDPNCSSGGSPTKWSIWQPRVGVAYRLTSNGSTALRAGWGMYSNQMQMQSFLGFAAAPWVRTFQEVNPFQSIDNIWASNGASDPFAAGFHDGSYVPPADYSFATEKALGFSVGAIDKSFRPAYVEQSTLSLQHAITQADSIEIAYVGNIGVHIAQTYDANLPVYVPGASAGNEMERRPYGSEGLAAIKQMRGNSNMSYNGLNVTYHRRGKGGLELFSGFNWSKCIDDGSQPATTNGMTANGDNPELRRGVCDYDQNYAFRNTVIWSSPALKSYNDPLRAIAGSWVASALVVDDAGQSFSVTDTNDYSYTGIGLDLADYSAGYKNGSVPLRINGHLNKAAFADNAPGTYGNTGRNSFRSQGWVNVDAAMMKVFPIVKERTQLMFRAETFNLFNHPSWLPPNSSYNNSTDETFGISTSARPARILQFSLKLMF
jgi:outer membrane receptor protein involved in Fe transport